MEWSIDEKNTPQQQPVAIFFKKKKQWEHELADTKDDRRDQRLNLGNSTGKQTTTKIVKKEKKKVTKTRASFCDVPFATWKLFLVLWVLFRHNIENAHLTQYLRLSKTVSRQPPCWIAILFPLCWILLSRVNLRMARVTETNYTERYSHAPHPPTWPTYWWCNS